MRGNRRSGAKSGSQEGQEIRRFFVFLKEFS
jgi:hypothetical protein